MIDLSTKELIVVDELKRFVTVPQKFVDETPIKRKAIIAGYLRLLARELAKYGIPQHNSYYASHNMLFLPEGHKHESSYKTGGERALSDPRVNVDYLVPKEVVLAKMKMSMPPLENETKEGLEEDYRVKLIDFNSKYAEQISVVVRSMPEEFTVNHYRRLKRAYKSQGLSGIIHYIDSLQKNFDSTVKMQKAMKEALTAEEEQSITAVQNYYYLLKSVVMHSILINRNEEK